MASIMCNANNMTIHMQAKILTSLVEGGGFTPIQGWMVRGSHFTVCVVGQRFCFLEQEAASLNQVVSLMMADVDEGSSDIFPLTSK
jgi:roadblock/LC7 domain-containing protein